MNTLTIPDLQQGHQVQTIRLRVTRIWNCIHTISRIPFSTAFVGVNYRMTDFIVPDHVGIYDRHFFDFSGEDSFEQVARWETFLADVIGVITSIRGTAHMLIPSGGFVGKKDITVMTFKGRQVNVTLWEPSYNNLDIPMMITSRPRHVVIFSGMRVRSYYGGITLTSTSATKVYVNLDIPETSQAQRMFARMGEANGHLEGNN
ncbi:Nucleic acid-binding protein [Corchorus olitorius]|uniref:Nucleic acid-binding protein n=1 Tax=Corchorus olitorius TaxID=93759 RepID=A0A1R3JG28_9ROSI|nr:Nucleic acid-binding protein [Corchorus olitorius]